MTVNSAHMATAGGLALLVLGAALGALLDVELNLRVMHLTLAAAFVLLTWLMLQVQIERFYRPDKGPGDWVAWVHFVIFACLLFLAARMARRWCRTPSSPSSASSPSASSPARLIVTYRGQRYDATAFAQRHPGGSVIWRANGRDLDEVWEEFGVGWHANEKHAYIDRMIRRWPRVSDDDERG